MHNNMFETQMHRPNLLALQSCVKSRVIVSEFSLLEQGTGVQCRTDHVLIKNWKGIMSLM